MKSLINSKKRTILYLIAAIGINLVLFLLVLKLNNCLFVTNDDMTMRDIAAGAYTGTPDGHLVFIQYAMGALISGLYSVFATVPWYSVVLYGTMFLSFVLILYRLLALAKNAKMFVLNSLCFAFLIAVLFKYLVYPQYTVASAILGGTAIFWYFTQKKEASKKEFVADTILIALLCSLSYMMRQDSFLICAAVLLVGFIIKLIAYKKAYLKRAGILVLVLLLCLGSIFITEKVAYSAQEFKDYEAFNVPRSRVYDYHGVPPYEADQQLYQKIGIDYSTYLNLTDYSTEVGSAVNAEAMEAIADANDVTYKHQTGIVTQLRNAVPPFADMFLNAHYINVMTLCVLMFLATALFISILNHKRMKIWLLILSTLTIALLAFYIAFGGRIIERVTMIFILVSLMVSFSVIAVNEQYELTFLAKCKGRKVISWVLAAAFFVFAGAAFVQVVNKNKTVMASEGAFLDGRFRALQTVETYMQEHPQNLYYSSVYVLTNNTDKLLTHNDTQLFNNAYAGGWMAKSPMHYERLEKLGMKKDFAEGLVTQPQALFLSPPDNMPSMKAYIEEHYENKTLEQVDMIQVTDASGASIYNFGVYRATDRIKA